jgi:PAS domain S-box-containing protein
MPIVLIVDITALAVSLMVCTALLFIVGGSGIRKPLNLTFALFVLLQAGWAGASLLLRISLWFHLGEGEILLYTATACFTFTAPFLLLFVARFTGLRSPWPGWAAFAVIVVAAVHTVPMLQGSLVRQPFLDSAGATIYGMSTWGYAAAAVPGLCIVLALVPHWIRRRHMRQPFIIVSIALLAVGFALGALVQIRLPVMSITSTAAVSILGWGIMRRQLFNPLRELTASLRERSHRQELIAEISRRTTTLLELDELLLQAVALIRASFEYFTVGILLVEGQDIVLRASTLSYIQAYSKKFRLKVGEQGICGWVAATGQPLLVGDVRREPRYIELTEEAHTLSELAVPIRRGERVIGVLDIQSAQLDAFDEGDLVTQQTIADQLSNAIENARLYEEVRMELDVRARTEKILRESEEKFRNLSEQTPNMIFIRSRKGVVYANRQCELSMGYTRSEFYAPTFDFQSLTAPAYEEVVAANFRRHERGEEVNPYEYALINRAGRRIEAILTTKLISYEGEPAILGIITDITTRKRTESLLQSLNTAALAMEQALTPVEIFPVAVRALSTLGLDSVVYLMEDTAADGRRLHPHCRGSATISEPSLTEEGLMGTEEGSRKGFGIDAVPVIAQVIEGRKAAFTCLQPEAITAMEGSYGAGDSLPSGRGPRTAVLAPLSVGDDLFGLLVVSGADLGPDDVPVLTAFAHQAAAAWRKTGIMRDLEESIRQLKLTQEQLLHAQKMEAIGRLAGGIAHDFNNILTVISGYTSLLMDNLEGNIPAQGDLNQIRNTIKRAAALTSRLLAFGRKQILQPTVLDINTVVANSVTLLRPLIGEDIEIAVRLAPVPVCLRADHYQIEQILMNLAVNARDAMPGGGKLVLYTAGLDVHADGTAASQAAAPDFEASLPAGLPPGPWVVLKVQDNGVGMSEEIRARLFEPFFTTKAEGKGSGLGLSTVYGIVTQSGGRVRVESEPGSGATFTICLPRVRSREEDPSPVERAPTAHAGSGTVLLVEDESSVRDLAQRVLEKAGYRVIPVSSAREALQVAEGTQVIDAVVTDVVMPGGMSGVEMEKHLERIRPSLPVLYMSGYADDMRIRADAGDRNLRFLGKPFQPADLLAKVQEMILPASQSPFKE